MVASIDAAYGEGMGMLVFEEFEKDWQEIQAGMVRNTREIARANHARPNMSVEGLGQRVMSVDPNSWAYWANREPGCWNDKKFRDEYLRDNPEARVPYTPRTASIIKPATNYTRI